MPDWTQFDPEARPGELVEWTLHSQAQRRDNRVTVYLPARYQPAARYPLLVVHDGGDYLEYSAMKTVLDNLIHRLDMAETVVAFTYPGRAADRVPQLRGPRAVDRRRTAAGAGEPAVAGRPAARAGA